MNIKRSDIILTVILIILLFSAIMILIWNRGVDQTFTPDSLTGGNKSFSSQFDGENETPNEKIGPKVNTDGIKVNKQDWIRSPNLYKPQNNINNNRR